MVVVVPDLKAGAQETRIVESALRCIGRWGVAKTTIDDIAREAGCSRATIYRIFPGGKDAVLDAVVKTEVARFFAGLAGRLESAETLGDVLVSGITEAGRRIRDHSALQFLLAYEPETIVPHLAFRKEEEVLGCASTFAAPYLERWLEPADALRAAEWAARMVLSYVLCPATDVDLTDETSVGRLVTTFMLPGLTPWLRRDHMSGVTPAKR